jgi:antirestriction protein
MLKQEITVTPRIYVACLAAYNAGKLHGQWIGADQGVSDIHAAIVAILKESPERGAEEWAVHDFEGFGGIDLGEWPNMERVSALARLIQDHGDAFSLWYANQDGQHIDANELDEKFLEQWQGAHDSEVAFADSLLEDTGQLSRLPDWARSYFDYQAYARDLQLSGDYSFIRHHGQIYVYCNH